MSDPLEFVPAYISPLTDQDHARIGRIAVLWGQIEYSVEGLTSLVSGLSWDELAALGIAAKPIATKVDFLKAASFRLADQLLAERVREFCAIIHDTKGQRNHVFHGMWGFRGDHRTKTVRAAARKTLDPAAPFLAEKLSGLEKKMCKCSRLGGDLTMHFWGERIRPKFQTFFHHNANSDDPKWLEQWSERNPRDEAALDHTAKVGELPCLKRTPPPK